MNYYNHAKGTICVERSVNDRIEWLAIPQNSYKEWSGCFSVV